MYYFGLSRYFASGTFQRHIASVYRLSKSSFGIILSQVSNAIILEMKGELIDLNERNWIQVANEFNFKWQLPNCLGAVDGKHISIRKPAKSGTEYYNYKRFHSFVLMAIADANYRFLSIDIGGKGSEGDSNIFSRTKLGKMIKDDDARLCLPPDSQIGHENVPYFFIGDDAFPLVKRLLKPYSPKRNQPLTEQEIICNYRISRARRCVENAFGILVAKWACVGKTFFSKPVNSQRIVAACCLLHNFMINQKPQTYIPERYKDLLNENGEYVNGIWRNYNDDNILERMHRVPVPSTEEAKHYREILKVFVNSPRGALSFQRRANQLE